MSPQDSPPQAAPRWFDPTQRPFLFTYSKAFGLGFDPRSLDSPFLLGGEYDGIRPVTAEFIVGIFGLGSFERFGMSWIVPFVQMKAAGQDFTLDELVDAARAHGCPPFARTDLRL